eukprot:1271040-Rhodomonas_salina.2
MLELINFSRPVAEKGSETLCAGLEPEWLLPWLHADCPHAFEAQTIGAQEKARLTVPDKRLESGPPPPEWPTRTDAADRPRPRIPAHHAPSRSSCDAPIFEFKPVVFVLMLGICSDQLLGVAEADDDAGQLLIVIPRPHSVVESLLCASGDRA